MSSWSSPSLSHEASSDAAETKLKNIGILLNLILKII